MTISTELVSLFYSISVTTVLTNTGVSSIELGYDVIRYPMKMFLDDRTHYLLLPFRTKIVLRLSKVMHQASHV